MPDVRAVKSGNWSDVTVWNTGTLPTASDDVYANTFTINVDTSFEVLSLRNTSGTGITVGGVFNFSSGSITGSMTSTTGFINAANQTTVINVTANTGTVTINAPNANLVGIGNAPQQLLHSGPCNLVVVASTLTAGGSGNHVIVKPSVGSLTLTGNLFGGTVAITGNALIMTAGSATVIGNVNALTGPGINILTACSSLTITGSLIASSSAAVSCTTPANINILGSLIPSPTQPAINSTGAHVLIHSGSITASTGSPAVISSNANAINVFTGPFNNTGNIMAVQCARVYLTNTPTEWQFTSDVAGVSQSLFPANQLSTYPSASNVRLGTVYASGSLVGTLAMPTALSVELGVLVDNTTGSAVITTASLAPATWDRARTTMTTTGSIGERLQNIATPTIIGNQISSYLL